jgi:hypothetical protein
MVLSRNCLLGKVIRRVPDVPPQVTRLAMDLVLKTLPEVLAMGRPVTLRGFGRLIPRRYTGSPTKRLGLLFHPSPQLTSLIELSRSPGDDVPEAGTAACTPADSGPEAGSASPARPVPREASASDSASAGFPASSVTAAVPSPAAALAPDVPAKPDPSGPDGAMAK